jgi:ribosomal protein L7/L12
MTMWTVIILAMAAAGAALVFVATSLQDRRATATQLTAIRQKLDRVIDHLGIADAEPDRAEVVALLENGRLIDAVRVYRRTTGASLLEAKQAVDRIAAERGLTGR